LAGSDLEMLRDPINLGVAFESIYAAAIESRLHIVGVDETGGVSHLAVDDKGKLAGAFKPLPLIQVTGLAQCAGSLVVCGVVSGDRAVVLVMDHEGKATWSAELPHLERLQHWPRPVCVNRSIRIVSMTAGEQSTIHVTNVAEKGLGDSVSIELADDTDAIDVIGDDTGVLIARVHGDSQQLEIMRVGDKQITARRDVEAPRPASPSLARSGERVVVGWISKPLEPRLQWFDQELLPLGGPQVLTANDLAGEIQSLRLSSRDDCPLVVFFRGQHVVADGGVVRHADGTVTRYDPRRSLPLVVAAYDSNLRRLGPSHLVDRDAKVYASAWLEDKLAIVHRSDATLLSIFECIEG